MAALERFLRRHDGVCHRLQRRGHTGLAAATDTAYAGDQSMGPFHSLVARFDLPAAP